MSALPAYMTVTGSHPTAEGVALDIIVDPKHPTFVAEVCRSARALAARNGIDPDDVTLTAALDEWAKGGDDGR